jgi:hypothetical protein
MSSNRLYVNFKKFERQLRNWETNAEGFGNGPAPRLSAANYARLGRINQNINNFKKRVTNSVAANKARGIKSAVTNIMNLEKRRFNYSAQGPSPQARQTLMMEIARLEKQIGNKIKMINKAKANAKVAETARLKRLEKQAFQHWHARAYRPGSKGSPGGLSYRRVQNAFKRRAGTRKNKSTSMSPPRRPRTRNQGTSTSPKRRV